jgi:Fe-S cluster assembly protein SufD
MAVETPVAGLVGQAAADARLEGATPAIAARRRLGWELYSRLPVPSSARDEDWRRTDISGLHVDEFVADPGPTDHGEALVAHLRGLRYEVAPQSAFLAGTRNGMRACEDTDRLTAQGVRITSLDEACLLHPDAVERVLSLVAPIDDPLRHGGAHFLALWNALWRGGTFVHVPAGVEAAVPVVAAYSAGGDHPAIFPATVALLEPHSSLTLIEVHASGAGDAPLFSDAVSALVVGEGALLDHCVLQQWGAGAWHIAHHRATLARGARLRSFHTTLGSRLQKSYIEALLTGDGADARIGGVAFGAGEQHLDHQSLQAHLAPHTTSNLLLKVAVRDRARSVYSGLIEVDEAARGTDGYVQNRNLMLSHGARATGIPRLEIRTDDVRCGHGVTAGHIDADEQFYLQARGVSPEEADRIIVRGFMQDAIDRCPHPGFAALVGRLLDDSVAGRWHAGIGEVDLPEAAR